MSNFRILYLYAGVRKKLFERFREGTEPDTALVGFNHLSQYGIHADFLENRLTEFFRNASFNLTQLPALFVGRSYDAIFSGSGILTLFVMKYLLRWKKPKWFLYNTYLTNAFRRNKGTLAGWVMRKAIHSADGIISPSHAQANFLRTEGLHPSKNFYIPYGVDADFYVNPKKPFRRLIEEPYIFSAGRDIGRDYPTLIEAVRGLPICLVIGALPRNFPNQLSFPPNVTVQYFPQTDMPSLYHHAEFVVISSLPEEKLSGSDCSGQYVLLEAMMSGKAVIASERTTLPDYFTDREDGFTFPPEDTLVLREKVQWLLAHPEEATKMGERARAKALNTFTTKRFARDLARILATG